MGSKDQFKWQATYLQPEGQAMFFPLYRGFPLMRLDLLATLEQDGQLFCFLVILRRQGKTPSKFKVVQEISQAQVSEKII